MDHADGARHLPLESIWDFAKSQIRPSSAEFGHLLNCDECVSLLGLCQMYDSITKVQQQLNELDDQKASSAK